MKGTGAPGHNAGMKRYCCALLLLSGVASAQEVKLEPWREEALANALRGAKLPRVEARVMEEPLRCAVPLVVIPADPGIDPKMVLKLKQASDDRMPIFKGLPVCGIGFSLSSSKTGEQP